MLSQIGILQELPVAKISHPHSQLRKSLDNVSELASSIKQYGLLQPIVVRPKNHAYEVVAGNRRLAAAVMLKLRKINCHLVELSDKEAYEVALVENVQHKSMNPIEEATAFAHYVNSFGWGGVTELANRIGRSQEFVTKRMQLLRLPENIHEEIIRQRITPSVALEMLPLDNESIKELGAFIAENPMTRNDVRQIVKASKCEDSSREESDRHMKKTITREKELYLLDKALKKSIAVMKSTMVNFDDIIEEVHDEWVLKELLMQYRLIMHGDIDAFLRLRARLRAKLPKEYPGSDSSSNETIKRMGNEHGFLGSADTKSRSTERLEDGCGIHVWAPSGIW